MSDQPHKLKLAISTCPNDTFIFGPLIWGYIDFGNIKIQTELMDISELNNAALSGEFDIVKISVGVYPELKSAYHILRTGGALSNTGGPIVVSKQIGLTELPQGSVIAIPGYTTTAYKIFRLFFDNNNDSRTAKYRYVETVFNRIPSMVESGEVDAGILIHEGRLVYKDFNLNLVADLGDAWQDRYQSPLPLGCIVINNENAHLAEMVNSMIHESMVFSAKNYDKMEEHILTHADSKDPAVARHHIKTYVNKYTKDLTLAYKGIHDLIGISKRHIL